MTPEAISLAFLLGAAAAGTQGTQLVRDTGVATHPGHAVESSIATAHEHAVADVSTHLVGWLADASPASQRSLRERVRRGAPPAALIAMLDAYRDAPRRELLDVVVELASYRRADVRGHALQAWAATDAAQADRAIAAACIDMDPAIRRVAWVLTRRHPSPAAQTHLREMLAHDAELANEVAAAAVADGVVEDDVADDEIVWVPE